MRKPFAMIIEDDRDTVALFRHVLDFAGYKTEIILRGEKAMERLKIAKPDIVLLDLNLPGVTGTTILNYIKEDPRLRDTPVVVITGHSELALGLNAQTDLVLLKPVSVDQLTNLILRLKPVDPSAPVEKLRDPLTGLYSRSFFVSRIGYAIERIRQLDGGIFGILFLDIDDFKALSEEKGEAFADFLLTEAANFFSSSIRTIDTLSRFDHDHFFIQIEDLAYKETLTKIAQRIQNGFSSYLQSKIDVPATLSVGMVYCTEEYLWPEDIIQDADIALHLAKLDPEDRLVAFNPVEHGDFRDPKKYKTIQRVGLSPRDPTKPRD
jgi:diguanylate cyclase (GGDEF)-like protein